MGQMKDGVVDEKSICSTGFQQHKAIAVAAAYIIVLNTPSHDVLSMPTLALKSLRMINVSVLGTAAITDWRS